MNATRPRRARLAPLLALASIGATKSCSGDLLGDPSFDLWCGDTLCNWEVEAGRVEKVATWHPSDAGASLVGGVVAISQYADATARDADCIRFDLTGDVDEGVQLSIEMDFYDDGIVEVSHPMTTDDYQEVSYVVTAPDQFDGIRFRIRKVGDGRAVLAQVRARAVEQTSCPADPPEVTIPDGRECSSDSFCQSGHCSDVPLVSSFGDPQSIGICSECDSNDDCGDGLIGGVAWDPESFYGERVCRAPAGDRPLGVACARDAECGSGVCTDGQCSECDGACDTGACARHDAGDGDADASVMPYTCDPGGGARATGEGCLADADCASGSCQSDALVRICDPDGRPCEGDADCPFAELGGACVTIGAADGVCE